MAVVVVVGLKVVVPRFTPVLAVRDRVVVDVLVKFEELEVDKERVVDEDDALDKEGTDDEVDAVDNDTEVLAVTLK